MQRQKLPGIRVRLYVQRNAGASESYDLAGDHVAHFAMEDLPSGITVDHVLDDITSLYARHGFRVEHEDGGEPYQRSRSLIRDSQIVYFAVTDFRHVGKDEIRVTVDTV
ncbi:MAG: hypothetical protein HY518_05810 [Candidatus Aenigmarchaeota archaeon]|nr:hypothetical protein [Candidatus Aenigmarchaeota archaeon]